MKEVLKMLNPKAWIALLGIVAVEYIGLYFAGGWLGNWTVDFVDKRLGLFKNEPEKEKAE